MSKKLNGFEALNAPAGTQFEVKYKKGTTRKVEVYEDEEGVLLKYIDIKGFSMMDFHKGLDTAEFIPIQQPVSFMEIVKSKKRCMVNHELIDNTCLDTEDNKELTTFNTLDWVLFTITNNQIDISEIILNGKWYIEESEELEDERLS